MALKVDPNQKGVTIVLIVILVSAIGVTAVRIVPQSTQTQAAPQQVATTPTSAHAKTSANFELARNPFIKPANLVGTSLNNNRLTQSSGMIIGKLNSSADNQIQQLNVKGLPGFTGDIKLSDKSNTSETDKTSSDVQADTEKPTFTLLATIQGSNGSSAVIRSGDSKAVVVKIGDTVDGRYRVKSIEAEQAVLTYRGDIIIAKRPHS